MSTTDALLFAEQATTSLYERVGDPDERRVLTLCESRAQYAPLPPDDAPILEEEGDATPVIVVQLRKRQGRTEIFIDGYLSRGEAEDGSTTRRHALTWHRGMHEDVAMGSRVLSPLAIVAAVEDGQHSFQSVTVSVLQQYTNNNTPVSGMAPLVLAETRLLEHRVSSVRCNVVHTPYPLACPSPPTITILDDLKKKKVKAVQLVTKVMGGAASITAATWYQFSTMFANNPWQWRYAALHALFLGTQSVGGGAIGTALATLDWWAPAAMILGVLKNGPGVYAMQFVNFNGMRRFSAVWVAAITPLAKSISYAIHAYSKIKKLPPLDETKFTIAELAATLESLSVLRAPHADALPEGITDPNRVKTTQYKRETVLWNWLLSPPNENPDASYNRETGGLPGIDTSELTASARHASEINVRVTVGDSLACDDDGSLQIHEFFCARDDKHLLGAAAAGTLEDLSRLYAAITVLDGILEKEINATRSSRELWLDRHLYNPVQYAGAFVARAGEALAGGSFEELADGTLRAAGEAVSTVYDYIRAAPAAVRGVRPRIAQTARAWWADVNDPMLEHRRSQLRTVRKHLQQKLFGVLFAANSPGAELYYKLRLAVKQQNVPRPLGTEVAWVRKLPQRAQQRQMRLLFPQIIDASTGRVDVNTALLTARVFSEYHDASRWFSALMESSKKAMRRLLHEWESNSATRMRMECLCSAVSTTPASADCLKPVSRATLALTMPVDIRFANTLASPTERDRRRIRIIVQRAKAQTGEKSVLEAMGLEHSDDQLLACQVFGDLWVEELVSLFKVGSKQAEMLEQASYRAAKRLRNASDHLLALVSASDPSTNITDHQDDAALGSADVALLATQAGRDAALFTGRVLFAEDFLVVRSAMAPSLRRAARAGVRAANAFAKTVPTSLPHDAVASLFSDRLDGVAAFLRVKGVTDSAAVLEAVAAAYPSVHLLPADGRDEAECVATARSLGVPESRASAVGRSELVRVMRFRLASLRMDFDPVDAVTDSPTSVDQLASRMLIASLSAKNHASFYVPFGFGDARPPPSFPGCAAPLFGTVPVYGPPLARAFRSVARAVGGTPPPTAQHTFVVRLEPTLGCLKLPDHLPNSDETESVDPNVVQVLRDGDVVVVRYAASRAEPLRRDANPPAATRTYEDTESAVAADAHHRSTQTAQLGLEVSSMAWNAERTLQAIVAALAFAEDDEPYDAVHVRLVLPSTDNNRASHWLKRPNNPLAAAQRERRRQQFRKMHDGILEASETHQRALVDAAIDEARTITDTGFLQVPEGMQLDDIAQRIQAPKGAAETATEMVERRHTLFNALFTQDVINNMLEEYQASQDDDVANVVGLKTMVDAARLEDLPDFVRRIEALGAHDAAALAAPVVTVNDTAQHERATLAATAIGMAMASDLLGDWVVECDLGLAREGAEHLNRLASGFENCAAVRLSEACAIASNQPVPQG